MGSKSFKQVLARQSRQFEQLVNKVEELRVLNESVLHFLDPVLAQHCRVANFRAGCLVVMADSAAWATRLRYAFPDLLGRLRYEARVYNLVSLHCIVCKDAPPPIAPQRNKPKMSADNAQLFADLASTESDPGLAEVFKKLSKHGRG